VVGANKLGSDSDSYAGSHLDPIDCSSSLKIALVRPLLCWECQYS